MKSVREIARSRMMPHAVVLRAQASTQHEDGCQISDIAHQVHASEQTVKEWIWRVKLMGTAGLYNRPRLSSMIDPQKIARCRSKKAQHKQPPLF